MLPPITQRPSPRTPSQAPTRPSFETLYMDLAHGLSKRSTCQRLQVGCVITSTDHRHVLAVGYNGNVVNGPNTCDDPNTPGACLDLHAEENAIINCCAPRATLKNVYITASPCLMCSKRLLNLGGVELVVYAFPYRNIQGVRLLEEHGITVRAYLPPRPKTPLPVPTPTV